jgi:hypothetical protein
LLSCTMVVGSEGASDRWFCQTFECFTHLKMRSQLGSAVDWLPGDSIALAHHVIVTILCARPTSFDIAPSSLKALAFPTPSHTVMARK